RTSKTKVPVLHYDECKVTASSRKEPRNINGNRAKRKNCQEPLVVRIECFIGDDILLELRNDLLNPLADALSLCPIQRTSTPSYLLLASLNAKLTPKSLRCSPSVR